MTTEERLTAVERELACAKPCSRWRWALGLVVAGLLAAAGIVWDVGACCLFKTDGHGKAVADGWGRPFHDTPAFVKWLKAIVGLNPEWVGWAWASFDVAVGVLSFGLAAYAVNIWRTRARAEKKRKEQVA